MTVRCVPLLLGLLAPALPAAEVHRVEEIVFRGVRQTARDTPARDIELRARIRHESGQPDYTIHGFFDGDGQGGMEGDVYKVRFTPTRAGRWIITEVRSSHGSLNRQREGDTIEASASDRHGFWYADEQSPGRRWYRRSDGSHQYIIGNTQYSFLSGMRDNGPTNVDIATDVGNNARYFKKLRMGLHGDRYPHPTEKPYLDNEGNPTDNGDFGHRPNPRWFHQRVDAAVRTGFESDLIIDLILCGPDVEDARANLRAKANNNDPAPFLRYIAARYSSFPNVWICLCNEYDIRTPKWLATQIPPIGAMLKSFLPYPTPLSVHPSSAPLWSPDFDGGTWFDHAIIQRKIRTVGRAADTIDRAWRNPGLKPRNIPVIDDELSYEGEGDRHDANDTIEAHLGAFLGGGYGSTGFKSGNKLGHYFWGGFTPDEHTAATSLGYLRETIDKNVTFWQMSPDRAIFVNIDPDARAMSWPGREYVLGTNHRRSDMVAKLPPGEWSVRLFDIVRRTEKEIAPRATGAFLFDAPQSRAALFVFKKVDGQ